MKKERKLVSYGNLCDNMLLALNNTYPNGVEDHLIAIDVGKRKPLYAVRVETDDAVFLVKVEPDKLENTGKPAIDPGLARKKRKKEEDEL